MKILFPIDIRHIQGSKNWELLSPFTVENDKGIKITVPIGFITDLSSVPWGLRNVSHPSEYPEAAVPHDYIYRELTHRCTKKCADKLFVEILKHLGAGKIQRKLMYWGVKFGGRGNW